MSTLLMRLSGPMQSWGTQSRFSEREAGTEPSKSGVIGLLCAALGRPREEPLYDLVEVRMGVRVDREGTVRRDYHTIGGGGWPGLKRYGVAKADGARPETVVSNRYYLSDADFLVGLEGDEEFLIELDTALEKPVWPLYLGRKSFIPGIPVRIGWCPEGMVGLRDHPGIIGRSLSEVLRSYPWVKRPASQGDKVPDRLRVVLDVPFGSTNEVRQDVPLSFAERLFTIRNVRTTWISRNEIKEVEDPLCISRD